MLFRKLAAATLIMGAAAMVATGCGRSTDGDDDSTTEEAGPVVGLVTDIGGLNDRSFNSMANDGFEQAKEENNASGTVLESAAASDYEPNLAQLAQDGSDIVFGIGFLMGDSVLATAEKTPDTDFAIVDFAYETAPDNLLGMVFKEQEAGYLAGLLAGAVEEAGELDGLNEQKVVSVVGGQSIPPVNKFIAGFQTGVAEQCADCEVLVSYSQDFVDQAKCQDRARAQIDQGSDIVFQVAGGCGLGALDAAKTAGVWGIGVDADQGYLGDHILTSAVKRVDTAVASTVAAIADGTFEGGTTRVFSLADDGVGLGEVAEPAQQYMDVVDAGRAKILDEGFEVPEEVS